MLAPGDGSRRRSWLNGWEWQVGFLIGTWLWCYDPGPHFSFSGPPFISQDIPCQPTPYPSPVTKSHGPKEYHVFFWTATSPFKSPLATPRPVIRPIGTLSFLPYCSLFLDHDLLLISDSLAAHSILSSLSLTHLLHILYLAPYL